MRLFAVGLVVLLGACLRETLPPADGGGADLDGGPGDGPPPPPIDGRIDAGPVGHDDDGDGVDDALDNCPHSANAMQRNILETMAGRMADTVGDICDPDPDLPGNSILFFDAMNTGVVPSRWDASGATANDDDTVRVEAGGYLVSKVDYPGNILVNIDANLGNVNTASNSIVLASNYVTPAMSISCRRQVTQLSLAHGSNPSTAAPGFTPALDIWMELMSNATTVDCGTSIDGGPWTAVQTPTASTLTGGNIAIMPLGTYATIDFVVVISRP
jgi:hypothetical protein